MPNEQKENRKLRDECVHNYDDCKVCKKEIWQQKQTREGGLCSDSSDQPLLLPRSFKVGSSTFRRKDEQKEKKEKK
jgi:hypothetical protein